MKNGTKLFIAAIVLLCCLVAKSQVAAATHRPHDMAAHIFWHLPLFPRDIVFLTIT